MTVTEAQSRLLGGVSPIADSETVGLHDADGRVLCGAIAANLTQPPFDASAMDGYALRGADAPLPGAVLSVIGESAAGHGFSGSVGAGEAVRIFTGAPMPDGADTVLIQEDAERLDDGRRIKTTFPIALGRHVRPRGQDFLLGETVLADGTPLDFARLTLVAAMNHGEIAVYRKPLVALIATGDELVRPGTAPGPSQIVGSNTFGIAALARQNGADVLDLGIVADKPEAIAEAIERATRAKADILVTLGGASVGDHDLVQSTLIACGMQLDFWKIAMRPGKPLMVGSLGDMRVLGLPGNPVSSMVCALLFLEPLLARMTRLTPLPRDAVAITTTVLAANDKRQDFLRARLGRDEAGALVVTSYGKQDSSMMKIFAQSDCLIVRPPHGESVEIGAAVPVLLLRPFDG
nr:gephyrin-like molybdotransferase Glp [Rhizobium sp. CG5]